MIIKKELRTVDSRFIMSRIGQIKDKWEGGNEIEYLAIDWAIKKYLELHPYGKYDEIKKDVERLEGDHE